MEENPESEIEHLYRIEKFMESMTDMDRLLEVIIREGRAVTAAESCSLALYDENSDELYFYVAIGEGGEQEVERKLKCIRMKMGVGIVGWTAVNMKPANVTDVYNDPRFYRQADKQTGFVTRSILSVPMIRREKLIGVVQSVNKQNQEGFSEYDEKVLTVLAAQAALVIENAKLYEESLRQARLSALGQGIAGAAHCINNILTSVEGGSYIFELGIQHEDMERITKGWDIIKQGTKFLRELVLDMLDYCRPQKLECEPTDINETCMDVAKLMLGRARQKNIDILLELQPDIGQIILDSKGIYRCILNIVSNAIDACDKPKGIVKIATHLLKVNNLAIEISDNGCGISEENRKNIFKVFFSTKGSKGAGLGLAVTQKIISEHGGNISVESQLGVGTKFKIILPMNGSFAGNLV
ncbi:GAF domain-containing protein [Candidatus Poribacteria bacterium]|nr:GAF domain-containing protein [Candidatus Poribacteria bacterium]